MFIQFINDSQMNDRFHREHFPIQGRLFLHYGTSNSVGFEWNIWSRFCHVYIEIESGELKFGIAFPPISLWLVFEYLKWANFDREISIHVHDWSIHWKIWADSMGWSTKTPKYRDGWFGILDFFLGRKKYSEQLIEEREVLIPMPEKSYDSIIKLTEDTWKRKRWFSERRIRAKIDIPEGIPHEGKGENSWDCGTDGVYGLCCCAKSIPEAVGILVGGVLETRVRCGGWKDWTWEKDMKLGEQ